MRSEHCGELLGDVRGTVEGTVYMCKLQRPTSESDYWRQSLCLSAGAVMSQSPGVEPLTVTRDENREWHPVHHPLEDMHSLSGACGPLPAKVDVHALHAASLAYPGRPPVAGAPRMRGWLDWLRGR